MDRPLGRLVVALGGNALLRRGETPGAGVQRAHVRDAARALAPLTAGKELVIVHGNGPQVGLLALEREKDPAAGPYPLDVLDAETEGLIGYLIQQELDNVLPAPRLAVALVTQVEVDARDPAFDRPVKPIGRVYERAEAERLARERNWSLMGDGAGWRRAVASPAPRRVVELEVIRQLMSAGVVVVCAGGGGVPVTRNDHGTLTGIEAVIDKDHASTLLARELGADALLLLTDVDALYTDWNTPDARALRCIGVEHLERYTFEPGTMAPKAAAAADFALRTGGLAVIGALEDAAGLIDGSRGTRVLRGDIATQWWP